MTPEERPRACDRSAPGLRTRYTLSGAGPPSGNPAERTLTPATSPPLAGLLTGGPGHAGTAVTPARAGGGSLVGVGARHRRGGRGRNRTLPER
ncbi:MAG: hypothetical protein ACRDYD_09070, partial [Acidimicrobiales bacterium]